MWTLRVSLRVSLRVQRTLRVDFACWPRSECAVDDRTGRIECTPARRPGFARLCGRRQGSTLAGIAVLSLHTRDRRCRLVGCAHSRQRHGERKALKAESTQSTAQALEYTRYHPATAAPCSESNCMPPPQQNFPSVSQRCQRRSACLPQFAGTGACSPSTLSADTFSSSSTPL